MSYSSRGFIYLTVYILFDLFNEKTSDTRSGKSKADEGKENSELI